MSDTMTIRRAREGDQDALSTLIHAHAAYENAEPPAPDIGASALQLQESGRLWCWVAETAGSAGPVGYASATEDVATFTGRPFGHMDCLFVSESERGSGVGQALLRTVASWSRSRSHLELQWQSPDWNTRARSFYEREGAKTASKVRFFLKTGPTSERLPGN